MKRAKKNQFIDDSEWDGFLSSENDTDTENDEDSEFCPSDGSVSNVNSASKGATSKQKTSSITKKSGKMAQQDTNSIRKNLKRMHSKQTDGVHTIDSSKRKKSTHDDNKKNDGQANRKGSRECTKTNRFGTRESTVNFNDFFKNLASQRKLSDSTQNSSTTFDTATALNVDMSSAFLNEETNSTNSMADKHFQQSEYFQLMSNHMKKIEEKIDAQFSVLLKQNSRIEALLKYYKTPVGMVNTSHKSSKSIEHNEILETGDQCENHLKAMGLPINEIQQLVNIEENLKNANFESQMVNFFHESNVLFVDIIYYFMHYIFYSSMLLSK